MSAGLAGLALNACVSLRRKTLTVIRETEVLKRWLTRILNLWPHLMRRAGFGATRDELEARVARGYGATVEELLNPDTVEGSDRLDFLRYQPGFWKPPTSAGMGGAVWLNDMVNTKRVLQEKMVLFWHQVFATGYSKIDHFHEVFKQIDMFREQGMGNYRDLLVDLAKDPAMIYWLDNCDNQSTPSTRIGAVSCWNCSAWVWATTPRMTYGSVPGPSPAGPFPR